VRARDVMTLDVVTTRSSTSIEEAATLMLERGIGGMPVVDEDERVVGMVSDGDIARRTDAVTERAPWWQVAPTAASDAALDFIRGHLRKVKSVMTSPVVTVDGEMPIARIGGLFEEFGIKRVPVTDEQRIIGIVGRGDLIRALATAGTADLAEDDQAIRFVLLGRLRDEAGVRDPRFNLTVDNGIVHLWGLLPTEAERRAVTVLTENTPGVRRVVDHAKIAETRYASAARTMTARG
jgi:CBS domain-containing protein